MILGLWWYWDSVSAAGPTPTPTPSPTPSPTPAPTEQPSGSGGRPRHIRTLITTKGLDLKPRDESDIMDAVTMLIAAGIIQ